VVKITKQKKGDQKMKTKYEYGEVYDIGYSYGIDIPKGKIQITGIVNYQILPEWLDVQSWETGDAEFDWDLMNKPWYYIDHSDLDEDEINIIPEFVIDELIHCANLEKIKKWRNETYIDKSEQNAIR
jgi:hypothetical protein